MQHAACIRRATHAHARASKPRERSPPRRAARPLQFDGVLENVSQDAVYGAAAQEAVDAVLQGYNATVFCYGQVRPQGPWVAQRLQPSSGKLSAPDAPAHVVCG